MLEHLLKGRAVEGGADRAIVPWNGQIWRFLPGYFVARSHNEQRYGRKAVTDHDLTIQDWGITYDELESSYDAFDKLCGTSGKAGNLNGAAQPGRKPTHRRCSARRPRDLILAGCRTGPSPTRTSPLTMPGFAWKLSDAEIADVATYLRNSWGNHAAAVTVARVDALRGKPDLRAPRLTVNSGDRR